MYNGYKNWTQWNVALWVNNDEGLYRMACRYCRLNNRADAARAMLAELAEMGVAETPDGARYSVAALRAAFVGI
jgi:hypothetical protein